jgi:trigger factor
MKKQFVSILLASSMMLALTACGDSSDQTENTLPLGDKVKTEYGTVTLCEYENLAADETIYEISDEDVDDEVNNLLSDYVQYEEKDTAENGDYVEVYMTGTVDGELLVDYPEEAGDTYDILLGYNEFGEEFDENLLGVTKGDTLSFSITYDEDYGDEDLAGMTVDYEISVQSVQEEILPELTEEFITETLGYASEDEMRSEIQEELDSYYNSDTAYYAKEDLLQQVVENSKFGDYSEELYDSKREEVDATYESYVDLLGVSTVDEVYDAFEMSEDDIEAEVLSQVYRTIAVYAIAEEQSLALTDAEYQAGVESYAQLYTEYYGEEYTADSLVEELGEDTLRYWILEDKVMDYLYEHATITQVVGSLKDDTDTELAVETDTAE